MSGCVCVEPGISPIVFNDYAYSAGNGCVQCNRQAHAHQIAGDNAARISMLIVALFAVLAAFAGARAEAQAFPVKPVRFIVPFPSGGGNDIVVRIIGQKLSDVWRRPVVVDYRPGAGGIVGTEIAVKSPPDGYTMVLSSIALAFNTALYKKLPYNTIRDLAPVTLAASQPSMLVVNPVLPVKSVRELVTLAKSRPGSIAYASGGSGSGSHLAAELLKLLAGIQVTHVPYKGAGPALIDLLGGQVEMMVSVVASTFPHVKAGRLHALAVTGAKRSPIAPDIPTLSEAGITEYEFNTWYGIQVPAKTPPKIINKLNSEVGRILQLPDVRERYASAGLDPLVGTPAEFGSLIRSEIVKWSKVVKAAGVTAD